MLLFRQPCVQFSLQATRPLKDYPRNNLPPEYDEDEGPNYALDEEDRINEILNDLEITDYDNVEKIINEPEIIDTHKDKIISE